MSAFTAAQTALIDARFGVESDEVTPGAVRQSWIDDPREVDEIVSRMRYPVAGLAMSPEFLATADDDKDVFLWKIEEQLIGKTLPAHRQTIGDCFAPDTWIAGPRFRRAKACRPGDTVYTGTGKRTVVQAVTRKISHDPLIRVTPYGGLPLEVTAKHRCLVIRPGVLAGRAVTPQVAAAAESSGNWRGYPVGTVEAVYDSVEPVTIPADEVEPGDYLLTPTDFVFDDEPPKESCGLPLSDPMIHWLFGLFVADGYASSATIEFTIGDAHPEVLEQLIDTLRGFELPSTPEQANGAAKRIRVHSRELAGLFRGWFYDENKEKIVPPWLFGSRAFINGLFAGDGHTTACGKRVITSTSRAVVHAVELSLIKLGRFPSVGTVSRSAGTYDKAKPLYRISWYDRPTKRQAAYRWAGYHARRVRSVSAIEGPHDVYDVGVWSDEHTVIANGYSSHNCVSHGWSKAVQLLVWREHLLAGTPPELVYDIASEPSYGFSRVEVGKGRLGYGDGSIGAWASEAALKYGNLERKDYGGGDKDLTVYSGRKAKAWGAPRAGVPDDLEGIARNYPVAMSPLVVTEDEAKAALNNYYPIPVCSGQGFTTTRDRDGFCNPRGRWAHCMCVNGKATIKRGSGFTLAAFIQQSWGNSPNGPDEVETRDGQRHKLPQGTFAIEFDVLVRNMLRGRDSFAPAGPQGFVKMPDFVFGPQ